MLSSPQASRGVTTSGSTPAFDKVTMHPSEQSVATVRRVSTGIRNLGVGPHASVVLGPWFGGRLSRRRRATAPKQRYAGDTPYRVHVEDVAVRLLGQTCGALS